MKQSERGGVYTELPQRDLNYLSRLAALPPELTGVYIETGFES